MGGCRFSDGCPLYRRADPSHPGHGATAQHTASLLEHTARFSSGAAAGVFKPLARVWLIYTSADDGTLEALEETPFPTEDELQALIAEHRELLDGEQIRPGDARRWILVTREKGIAPSPGEAARWAVDHLIIDQDAVPTLAEVKRGSNPEIRRTIVGQLLEYAAHASETWTAEELRGAFERQAEAQGRDADAELAALLKADGDPDVDGFWEDVSTNLAAKRLRLLFVADFIPDPLARVISELASL